MKAYHGSYNLTTGRTMAHGYPKISEHLFESLPTTLQYNPYNLGTDSGFLSWFLDQNLLNSLYSYHGSWYDSYHAPKSHTGVFLRELFSFFYWFIFHIWGLVLRTFEGLKTSLRRSVHTTQDDSLKEFLRERGKENYGKKVEVNKSKPDPSRHVIKKLIREGEANVIAIPKLKRQGYCHAAPWGYDWHLVPY
ncbi:hypothetical protein HAX54_005147 [Datura stramonium]|uniref:Uncharacterized protein n=1 Tax=Datura stramonium TaxID=4076 RepID=A0ABS8T880_DATST|nr:hypothetical protein [Datura stramonium]